MTLKYKTCRIKIYDIGGGPHIRSIWKNYYSDVRKFTFIEILTKK